LVEKESLGQQVEAGVKTRSHESDAKIHIITSNATQLGNYDVEQIYSRQAEAEDRIKAIKLASHELQDGIKTTKKTAEDLRAELAKRRGHLEAYQRDLEERKSSTYGAISKGVDRAQHRWDANHQTIADARSFLTREAASLCGLRQRRRRRPDGSIKEEYKLGGVSIVDLRELNSKFCRIIQAATC
jgi:hypothetical protein